MTTQPVLHLEQLAASDGSMVAIGNAGTVTLVGDEYQGFEGEQNVIYASAAGAAWRKVLNEPEVWLRTVAAGNGHFAVLGWRDGLSPTEAAAGGVGDPATNVLFVSDDTQNWMEVALPNPRVDTLAFGNGIFVASDWQDGANGHVYVSTDARTWEDASSGVFKTLDFAAGRFVGTNGSGIAVSTDGRDWVPVSHDLNPIEDVAVVADRFVAVTYYDCCAGERGYTYQLATSPDGLTWTQQVLEGSAAFPVWSPAGCVGVTLSGAVMWLSSGASCASADYSLSSPGSMILVEDRAYAIHMDDHLATSIVTSTDALNWTTLLK